MDVRKLNELEYDIMNSDVSGWEGEVRHISFLVSSCPPACPTVLDGSSPPSSVSRHLSFQSHHFHFLLVEKETRFGITESKRRNEEERTDCQVCHWIYPTALWILEAYN